MSGVVFTPAAGERISRAVRWVEAQRQAGGSPVGPARGVEPVWVRLTSGTADGDGLYPGVITLYSGVAEAWSDYSAVKVAPLNGETLANATRYAVRPSGRTPAGDELYTVIGTTVATTPDPAAAVVCVTSATPRADGLLNGVVMEWNAGAVDLGTSATTCAVFMPHGEDLAVSYDVQYAAVRTGTAALDGKPVYSVSLPEAGRSATENWHGVLTGGTGNYAQYVPGVGLNWGDLSNSYPYLEAVNEPLRTHDTTGTQYAMPMYTGTGAAIGFANPGALRALKCGIGCLDGEPPKLVLYASDLAAGFFESHTALRVEVGSVTLGTWDENGDLITAELGDTIPAKPTFSAGGYDTYYDDGAGGITTASGLGSGTLADGTTVVNGLVITAGTTIDGGTW